MGNDSLEKLLGIVCSVFDAYSTVLFLPEENTSEYYLRARFSLGDDIREGMTLAPGQGLVGWIIRNGDPLLINNFDRTRSKLGYYASDEESKIKAFMGCPIQDKGGALCVDSCRTYNFSDKDQKILQLFAMLASDIHNGDSQVRRDLVEHRFYRSLQLIQLLRKQFPRWDTFLQNFLRIVAEASGFSHCFLAACDDRGESYFIEGACGDMGAVTGKDRFPIKSGLVGWVFGNGQSICSGDGETKAAPQSLLGKNSGGPVFHSALCMPLGIHRRTRGVLVLAHREPRDISPEVKRFVEMSTDHLALFLENLFLKSRIQQP
ncbi:signal transduction protein with GAF and PtsI domain [Desulfobaculum xiamenense]|uniref:Signal transduction protein with GAF and PtsI domain n=1 Tax=Desulfobaculum xiamenense TaxID=995050 RepID=A0A846QEJ9_9BACT|nr:GAF domain-containing protein [Desulfobaculum xiamenense]NJB66788.1 signal transduction protein with GAF and PtsI domain [Desulfobaculum xiamenense]